LLTPVGERADVTYLRQDFSTHLSISLCCPELAEVWRYSRSDVIGLQEKSSRDNPWTSKTRFMAMSIHNLFKDQPFGDLVPHFHFAKGIKGEFRRKTRVRPR